MQSDDEATGRHTSAVFDVVAGLDAVVELLVAHRRELDDLNVFPVPDADTGANVLATLQAARAGVGRDGGRAGHDAAEAAVRSARGNSGIMLAQVLRALLDVEHDLVGRDLAERLTRADELARAAVAAPVDGSLLSAVAAAAAAARSAAEAGRAGRGQLAAATSAAHHDVANSPMHNDVLARAGVVDAGGRAVALVLEALDAAMAGREPTPPPVEVPVGGVEVECSTGGGRYEVMYLLEEATLLVPLAAASPLLPQDAALVLRDRLHGLGDSVVVVAGDDVVSAHVHTDDVGAAVAAGIVIGAPSELRIEDLHAQASARAADVAAVVGEVPQVIVGVAAAGLRSLVEDLGATVLPLGDDHAGPLAIAASLAVAAARRPVLLLPGSPGVAALSQEIASSMHRAGGHALTVVEEATGPGAVVTALAVLDPAAPSRTTVASAIAATRTAAVTGGREPDAVLAVVERLAAEHDHEIELVTLLLGPDVDGPTAETVRRHVAGAMPGAEVEVLLDAVPGLPHVVVE